MNQPPTDARFSDEAVAMILRKAAELQEKSGGMRGHLTLNEIEDVAAEVGIEPRYVRDAVATLTQSTSSAHVHTSGTYRLRAQTSLPAALSQDAVAAILLEVARAAGLWGKLDATYTGLTFKSWEGLGKTTIQIETPMNESRVHITANRSLQALTIFSVAATAGFVVLGTTMGLLTESDEGAWLGAFIGAGSGIVWARWYWSTIARRWTNRVTSLLERVTGAMNKRATEKARMSAPTGAPVGAHAGDVFG